jgi:hypothetical protein
MIPPDPILTVLKRRLANAEAVAGSDAAAAETREDALHRVLLLEFAVKVLPAVPGPEWLLCLWARELEIVLGDLAAGYHDEPDAGGEG